MKTETTVLVVDDDPLILSGTARLLEQAGYTVLTAHNGEKALQSAQKHIPDLILLDNILPDMNGIEVCRRLKSDKTTSDILITILSGDETKSSDQFNGLEIEADETITRPIRDRELLARVNAILRLRNVEKKRKEHRNNLINQVEKRTAALQQEIADRRQAEEALQKSEAVSQNVLNSLTDHIAVLNDQGEIIAVNKAWREFACRNGCDDPLTVSQGANYFAVCRKAIEWEKNKFAEAALQGIREVMKGSRPNFVMEYPCHSPTEKRLFVMRVMPSEGMQNGVVIVHENITELKQTEATLRKRSQELTMLNKVSTQVSQSLSVEQVVSEGLEGVLQATEASAAFLLLKKGDDLIPAGTVFSEPGREFTEFPNHKIGECLCGMSVVERRGIYSSDINNDLRCTWEECKEAGLRSAAALPLFSGDEIIAVMGLGTDSVHNFEEHNEYLETLAAALALGLQNAFLFEKTQQHAQELTNEVRKRTRELEDSRNALIKSLKDVSEAKAQIETANQRLQELDRLKAMFIASMSHELRTPLNSIIGFTGILLQGLAGNLNEEQQDQLSRVSRAGKHLLALITDVIDVSKIEAGRVDLYPEPFDLSELITEAVAGFQTEAAAKGLTVTAKLPESIPMSTDRRRLLQCVINLLSNAVKYSEQGEISITAQKTDHQVEIRVTDNGIGIAESDLHLVFTSFVRLESHLKTATPGTGLGLYLTQKIVTELLGGQISVESHLAEGSTFTLILPVEFDHSRVSHNQELSGP